MNLRERFLEVMKFNKNVTPMKWEFGYWGETIDNWYRDGLPKKDYPKLPKKISTPTSHLYSLAWNSLDNQKLPKGIAVMAGGLYWPTQGFPLDNDVRNYFNMDKTQIITNVNLLFEPMFDTKILMENEERLKYRDIDGVVRIFLKEHATMPSGWKWPITDWESWEKIKNERINLNNIKDRFPDNWDKLVENYKNRDYPLALGGYPYGFFGTLAHLMGYEKLFASYYEQPELLHDILNTFTELWIAIFSEILSEVEIDHFQIWEDISFGSGSMVSPKTMKEFMLPYYKRLTDFLKGEGVEYIFVDTDGDCMDIIPIFLEGGVNGMFPFEWHAGMDIIEVRKKFPDLIMMGGIPKSEIAKGEERIDEILKPVKEVLKTGGYIPFGDHFIPPEVPWENFKYYRNELNKIIDDSAN